MVGANPTFVHAVHVASTDAFCQEHNGSCRRVICTRLGSAIIARGECYSRLQYISGATMGMPTTFALHLRNNLAWPLCNGNMIACNDDEGENVRLTLADWIPVPWDGMDWAHNAGRWSSTASSPASCFSLNRPILEVEIKNQTERHPNPKREL